MIIHVVQSGETIQTIANYYGISIERLVLDNGLYEPYNLVIGQCIVIVYPELTYTVKEGDTLIDIANLYNVSIMQLLQNNPFLSDRDIYPGDIIVISYNKKGSITTHGNTVPYINKDTLRKTLPYLTYLSVLNYTATKEGDIITYYDDTEIIQITKEYGTMPLMLLTTLTIEGTANIAISFDILLSEDFQNRQIANILNILRTKGYYGVNISFQYISQLNLYLYENYLANISKQLSKEGYLVFVTINPDIMNVYNEIRFTQVDYSILNQLAQNIIFMSYEWASNINPPSPISSIYNLEVFLDYINEYILTDKIVIGLATIGYDWELPYSAGFSSVTSMTLDRVIELARNKNAIIEFDEISQTPFFTYTDNINNNQIEHIVWFIDARSINSLLELVSKYELPGTNIWNITVYNTQLWLIINTQYEIVKVNESL